MADGNAPIMMSVAVLGGTGKEGSALAMRWALNGYKVIIGSRTEEKAKTRVAELNEELGGEYLVGMANEDAANEGEIVVLSVPYSAHKPTIESVKEHLSGKVVVDLTVPLAPPKIMSVSVPEGKAAALEAQSYLDNGAKVVAAFQNVSAVKLKQLDKAVDCDVLVCGDDDDAKADVIKLVEAASMRGIDAGSLENSVAVEALTPVLLYINKKYKVKGAGIRITGVE